MSSIVCPIAQAAGRDDAIALTTSATALSYCELNDRVEATRQWLIETGIEPGDRVAVLLPNSVDYIVLLAALWRLRATACPLSDRWTDAMTAAYTEQIRARHRIAETPAPTRIVTSEPTDTGLDSTAPATIVATSGTTSVPKAVQHSVGAHIASAEGAGANMPLTSDDRWMLSLPLYHVGGLAILWRCFAAGATVAVPDTGVNLEASIETLRPTHLSLVPTQLSRLLDAWQDALPRFLKSVLIGGAALAPGLVKRAHTAGVPLCVSYGLTEMASQVTTTAPGEGLNRLLTSGRVLPYRRLIISDSGEVLVRGRTLADGYVVDGKLEPFTDSDGWFHTGDTGRLDPDGYLTVDGRIDNMFVSGGENIHPEQIEKALLSLDDVNEALVVAVPDDEFGARPVAFVRATSDALGGLRQRLQSSGQLPRFMIPDRLFPWPGDLPETMKPNRRYLAELAAGLIKDR